MGLGTVIAFLASGIIALTLLWLVALAVRATDRPFTVADASAAPSPGPED